MLCFPPLHKQPPYGSWIEEISLILFLYHRFWLLLYRLSRSFDRLLHRNFLFYNFFNLLLFLWFTFSSSLLKWLNINHILIFFFWEFALYLLTVVNRLWDISLWWSIVRVVCDLRMVRLLINCVILFDNAIFIWFRHLFRYFLIWVYFHLSWFSDLRNKRVFLMRCLSWALGVQKALNWWNAMFLW